MADLEDELVGIDGQSAEIIEKMPPHQLEEEWRAHLRRLDEGDPSQIGLQLGEAFELDRVDPIRAVAVIDDGRDRGVHAERQPHFGARSAMDDPITSVGESRSRQARGDRTAQPIVQDGWFPGRVRRHRLLPTLQRTVFVPAGPHRSAMQIRCHDTVDRLTFLGGAEAGDSRPDIRKARQDVNLNVQPIVIGLDARGSYAFRVTSIARV